jgi:GGDEF domain-containing protein
MMIHPQMTNDPKSVLLVGSAVPTLSAGLQPDAVRVVRIDTVPQAIVALRRENFDKVCVSLSALQGHPEPALIGLRQANPAARIVLLAQMLEEPLIIDLMHRTLLSRRLFDDYLICPLRYEQIVQAAPQSLRPSVSEKTDADKDRRIDELEKLVIQDDLTGLKNRRYLRQFLPQVLDLAALHHLRVTLLIFDIDDFKHYNDTYGHTVGDNVLQQAGRMIQRCCRNHDVVARLGGDEFAVIFWDLPCEKHPGQSEHLSRPDRRNAGLEHPRQPIFMAERFCKELSQAAFEFIGPKGKGALTISGGLATFPTDAKTPEELFEKADMAMLEAKRSGKNRLYLVGQPA